MDARRYKTIEQRALDALTEKGMLVPNFDVFELLTRHNVKYAFESLPEHVSGASMIDGGLKVVTINQSHYPNRQRFTAAHELGHILLEHNTSLNISEGSSKPGSVILYRNDNSSLGSDWKEVEANHFAASLLMPRFLVDQEIVKLRSGAYLTESNVTALATAFGVSEISMSIRLGKLGYL